MSRKTTTPDDETVETGETVAQNEWCTRCREYKPLKAFECRENTENPQVGEVICRRCHEQCPPPIEPEFGLKLWERKALAHYFRHGNITQAAKHAGVAKATFQGALSGKDRSGVRHAFQYMLEREGMDLFSIVRMIGACFNATEAKYNPSAGRFEAFPDYKTRLRTAQTLTKIHELEKPRGDAKTQVPVQINLITNLGDGAKAVEAPGTITVEAKPVDG